MDFNENEGTLFKKFIVNNESSPERKVHSNECFHRGIKSLPYKQFEIISETSRNERIKHTQKELKWGDNQN